MSKIAFKDPIWTMTLGIMDQLTASIRLLTALSRIKCIFVTFTV